MNEESSIKIIPKNQKYLLILSLGFTFNCLSSLQMKLIKVYIGSYDPFHLILLRSPVISLCGALKSKYNHENFSSLIESFHCLKLVFIRSFSHFLAIYFYILSLNYLRLSTSMIFTSLSPIFTFFLSIIFLNEKFRFRYILGFIICFLGSYIIINNERNPNINTFQENLSIGNLIMGSILGILHSFFMSCQTISNKLALNYNITSDNVLLYMGIYLEIFSLTLLLMFQYPYLGLIDSPSFYIAALSNGIINFIANSLNNYAYKQLDLISTTTVSYIMIVESIIFGIIFLNENIYLTDILGMALIIGFNIFNVKYPSI